MQFTANKEYIRRRRPMPPAPRRDGYISFKILDLILPSRIFDLQKMEFIAMPQASGKICVIRLSSLGDLVLMVPMLRALRSAFPSKEIHLVCKEKYAGLFDGGGLVDSLIPVRRGDLREIVELRSALSRARIRHDHRRPRRHPEQSSLPCARARRGSSRFARTRSRRPR